jgi:hypothetical protein
MLLNFGSHTTHQLDMTMWLVLNGKGANLEQIQDHWTSAFHIGDVDVV